MSLIEDPNTNAIKELQQEYGLTKVLKYHEQVSTEAQIITDSYCKDVGIQKGSDLYWQHENIVYRQLMEDKILREVNGNIKALNERQLVPTTNIGDKCFWFDTARSQRESEVQRGLCLEGTESYKEMGCYDCCGFNKDCSSYHVPESKNFTNLD